jgi:hypothetical protein
MANRSVELNVKVIAEGQAQLDQIEKSTRGVGAASQAANTDLTQLEATIRTLIQSNLALRSSIEANTTALGEFEGAAGGAGRAAGGMVGQTAAASAALRALDGNLTLRSAGRFLGSIQGIGAALQAVFPVIGALAAADFIVKGVESLWELAQAWDPVIQAEKKATEHIKELTDEYKGLVKEAQHLKYEEAEREHGRAYRLRLEAGDKQGDAYMAQFRVERAQAAIDAAAKRVREGDQGPERTVSTPYVGVTHVGGLTRDARAAQASMPDLQLELETARQQLMNEQGATDLLKGRASDEAKKKALEAQRELDRAEQQAAKMLEQAQLSQLSGMQRLIAERSIELDQLGLTKKAIEDLNKAYGLREQNEFKRIREQNAKSLDTGVGGFDPLQFAAAGPGAVQQASALLVLSQMLGPSLKSDTFQFTHSLAKQNAQDAKDVGSLGRALDLYDEADARSTRRQADKAEAFANLNSGGDQKAAIESAFQLRKQLAEQLFEIETRRLGRIDDEAEREKAIAKAKLDSEDQLDKFRTERELKFAELRKKNIEEAANEARSLAGGLYSAMRGGSGGLRNFFMGQADQIGKTAFENLAGPQLQKALQGLAGMNIGGPLNSIFKGTILDSSHAISPEIASRDRNTVAVDTLTSAISGVPVGSGTVPPIASGSSGSSSPLSILPSLLRGGSSASSLLGALTGAGGGSAGSLFGALASSGGGGSLPSSGDAVIDAVMKSNLSQMDSISAPQGSWWQQNGGAVGRDIAGAGMTYAGIQDIVHGTAYGGARGALGTAAGIYQTGAGIAEMVPGGQEFAAGLQLTSMILQGVKAMFGDPKQQRQTQIQQFMQRNQYLRPPSINQTVDQYGMQAGYDAMGQARSLDFAGFPVDITPTQYDKYWNVLPGSVSTPTGPAVTVNVNALDSQSFIDHHQDIGDALATALNNGHVVSSVIQRTVNPS